MATKTDFTDREMHIMGLAWRCFDEQPKVNFEKLAGLAGFTNPRSASNAWATIKKKLAAASGEEGENPSPKKAAPKKRGKKAADEDGEEGTPAKKKRAAGKKGKKSEEKVDSDDEEPAKVKGEDEDADGEELV